MKSKFVVFTGPSAVGKATIEKHLFADKDLNLCLSVSATTRAPRKGEVDGIHYYFISKDEFNKKIHENAFVEWNSHFSHDYGTLKKEITRIANDGKVPFLEVEVIGAKNIIKNYGRDKIISIFIAPPSLEDLADRLRERGTENEDQIKERLERVKVELQYAEDGLFDHIVINDNVEDAVKEIKSIIKRSI